MPTARENEYYDTIKDALGRYNDNVYDTGSKITFVSCISCTPVVKITNEFRGHQPDKSLSFTTVYSIITICMSCERSLTTKPAFDHIHLSPTVCNNMPIIEYIEKNENVSRIQTLSAIMSRRTIFNDNVDGLRFVTVSKNVMGNYEALPYLESGFF